jgi:hypothetical protein
MARRQSLQSTGAHVDLLPSSGLDPNSQVTSTWPSFDLSRDAFFKKGNRWYILFRGQAGLASEWARRSGLYLGTLLARLTRYGWSVEDALLPSGAKKAGKLVPRHEDHYVMVEYEGRLMHLRDACRLAGKNYSQTLYRKNELGMEPLEALQAAGRERKRKRRIRSYPVEVDGELMPLSVACRQLDKCYHHARRLARAGRKPAAALEQARALADVQRRGAPKPVEFQGRSLLLSEWAKEVGVPYGALLARVTRHGWSLERALTTPVRGAKEAAA